VDEAVRGTEEPTSPIFRYIEIIAPFLYVKKAKHAIRSSIEQMKQFLG
jgi:hypothetical protein